MLPGNAKPPCIGQVARTAYYAGGGPDPGTAQGDASAGSFLTGLYAGAVALGRGIGDTGDHRTPQPMPTRPSLVDALESAAVGDDTAAEALPGRVYPSAWDGEPGWMAPGGTYV